MFELKLPTLLSFDRQLALAQYADQAVKNNPDGLIAEFGVYQGGTLELLAKMLPGKAIFGIDSFQGLPEATEHDFHSEGEFADVNHIGIVGYFKMLYPHVRILKGFSPSVFAYFDEHSRFSFVHLDVDMFSSVNDGLEFFWPKLMTGGCILVDDYGFTSTSGCKKAVDNFVQDNRFEKACEVENLYGVKTKQFLIIK